MFEKMKGADFWLLFAQKKSAAFVFAKYPQTILRYCFEHCICNITLIETRSKIVIQSVKSYMYGEATLVAERVPRASGRAPAGWTGLKHLLHKELPNPTLQRLES